VRGGARTFFGAEKGFQIGFSLAPAVAHCAQLGIGVCYKMMA